MPDGNQLQSASFLMKALGAVYDRATADINTKASLKGDYYKPGDDLEKAIDRLIKFQAVKAGSVGFVTNMGGLITLPVALPANLVGVFYIQIRMVATIADMRGYDIRSDQVKTFVLGCLAGEGIFDIIKSFGVAFSKNVVKALIMKVPGTTLRQINKAVGFRLATKAGTTGLVNLAKVIPFVGGTVGGTIDGIATAQIGNVAKRVFTLREHNQGGHWEDEVNVPGQAFEPEPLTATVLSNSAADQI